MILSTQTHCLADRLGDAAAIRILAQAGFDALDFSMFNNLTRADHPLSQPGYREYAVNLKRIADDQGIRFNQAHAPFPSFIEGNAAYNEQTYPIITRAIEVAAILGASVVVVHPFSVSDSEQKKALNLAFYRRLQPLCESCGIKVALENMWGLHPVSRRIIPNVCSTGESFAEYLDELDPGCFTGCLDLGHSGLVNLDAADMIRILGHDRLRALHVHDNDFLNDTHTAPFLGKMNWAAITAALADIDYAGDLTFEADNFLVGFPDELLPAAARFLQDIGRHLIRMISPNPSARI